jgi:hypothetical protein
MRVALPLGELINPVTSVLRGRPRLLRRPFFGGPKDGSKKDQGNEMFDPTLLKYHRHMSITGPGG